MMNYELFKNVVVERIMDYLPSHFNGSKPVVEKVKKVNKEMDALTIHPSKGDPKMALPIIYLNDLYDAFALNEDMDDILTFAAEIIVNYTGALEPEKYLIDDSAVRRNVIPNLINTEKNLELLDNVPHINVLDMSIIYRVVMDSSFGGYDTLVITNEFLEDLEMSREELHNVAMKNMKRMFPVNIDSIVQEETDAHRMFPERFVFVSSKQQLFGATYMIFDDILNGIAKKINVRKLFIIPFSVDEFVVIEGKKEHLKQLLEMLDHENDGMEEEEKFLSNSVYCFEKGKKSLRKVASQKTEKVAVN